MIKIKKLLREMERDYLFLRKIAFRTGWFHALFFAVYYSKIRRTLEHMCKLYNRTEEYEAWLNSGFLYNTVLNIEGHVKAFERGQKMNYNYFLNNLFCTA